MTHVLLSIICVYFNFFFYFLRLLIVRSHTKHAVGGRPPRYAPAQACKIYVMYAYG